MSYVLNVLPGTWSSPHWPAGRGDLGPGQGHTTTDLLHHLPQREKFIKPYYWKVTKLDNIISHMMCNYGEGSTYSTDTPHFLSMVQFSVGCCQAAIMSCGRPCLNVSARRVSCKTHVIVILSRLYCSTNTHITGQIRSSRIFLNGKVSTSTI